MILAPHDMRDAQIGIVDRRGQHVQPRSVRAPDHGIAHRRRIEPLRPADQIVPRDRHGVIEPEAPVRHDAIVRQRGAIRVGQRQRGAIVDRRQPAPQLDLALQLQFLRAFIRRIDPPRRDQFVEPRLIQREPVGLAHLS